MSMYASAHGSPTQPALEHARGPALERTTSTGILLLYVVVCSDLSGWVMILEHADTAPREVT